MSIVARASKTVRFKNLIIVVMCLVFCGMFLYDGFHTYPANNDGKVRSISNMDPASLTPETRLLAEDWIKQGGWNNVSSDMHEKMDAAIRKEAQHVSTEGWKGPFDVKLQRGLGIGLLGCVVASIWWFIHCQRRRAIAEDATVSPAPGVVIPWEKITRVDNARWKTVGIVDITFTDHQGLAKHATFDDYKLQREPLLEILDQLGEKAVNAEFVPKEEVKESGPGEKESAG